MAVSDWIKKVRTKAGLTQEQLADAIGRKKLSISRWENGERIPNADDLLKISMVTGIAVETPNSIQPDPDDSSDALPTPATGSVVYTYKETIAVCCASICILK